MITLYETLSKRKGQVACPVCGLVCRARSILHTHMMTHTGEKPFKCAFCSYCSARKRDILRHVGVRHKDMAPELDPEDWVVTDLKE